jgi:hypothetical protein
VGLRGVFSTPALACADTGTSFTTRYYSGSGSELENGDIVYIDEARSVLYNGGGLYYRIEGNVGSSSHVVQISNAGVSSNITLCT